MMKKRKYMFLKDFLNTGNLYHFTPDRYLTRHVFAEFRGGAGCRLSAFMRKAFTHIARVHRGGEHADVVGGGAIHSRRGASDSAEDVSTANNNPDLDAELTDAANLIGHEGNDGRVDAIRLFAE